MNENAVEEVVIYSQIPYNVISNDIPKYLKTDFYNELGEILGYYKVYEQGSNFVVEGTNGDYAGSDVKYKKCRTLIDKEARFMFSVPPVVQVNRNTAHTEQEKADATVINTYISEVFKQNSLSEKLLKAAKDCFIGKRVGYILNFSSEFGISITFLKSYEFVYEKDDSEKLTKFIAFYTILEASDKKQRRIKKKSYEMKNGVCYTHELIYDGLGNMIEEVTPEQATLFTYIPAAVILNDGLSNDGKGESEINQLDELEGLYSKLANSDIDAERKSMNAVRYAIDASPDSTANLSTAPGAFWDIKSDPVTSDPKTARVGMLESSMNYSGPLKTTLDRVNNQMHDQLDIPDINSEKLQGVITSGKTLKALYWSLMVRCDEKMLVWKPALAYMANAILDGAVYYPEAAVFYIDEAIPNIAYDIDVINKYPILEDSNEEKTMDLAEVQSMTMSRKAYMKKWRELTDEEVDEELQQILLEKQMFEDAYVPMEREDTEEYEEPTETSTQEDSDEAEGATEEELTDGETSEE